MAQLNVRLDEKRLELLRRFASRRRTPVSWLIQDYVEYLLAGGTPVKVVEGETVEYSRLAGIAERGGSFPWLAEEPELYSPNDGEPA